jgi:hypothetical protein
MRRAWLAAVLALLIYGGVARAEIFGVGGGLAAYLLDLRGLKVELIENGVPAENLAGVPDFAPLPHLLFRGRLGLPILISGVQLDVARLALTLPVEQGTGTSLRLDSTVISFSLLGELKALFIGFAFGIGTDLIQGEVGLSSSDPQMAEVIDELDLESCPWSVATVHGMGELELILGPLRLYLQGKYLYPLSQSGLTISPWEASLGLMIVI